MSSELKIEYSLSNATSPEDNILRVLFTFFLNTGVLDGRMKAISINPDSARTDHVGQAILKEIRQDFRAELISWIKRDELARYIMSTKDMMEALAIRMEVSNCRCSPIDTCLGTRYKALTGYARKKLPKDLKKSFYNKASNRVVKFVTQLRGIKSSPEKWTFENQQRNQEEAGCPQNQDAGDWLRYALLEKNRQSAMWSKPLREIRNIYWQVAAHEPVEEIVEELLKLAQAADVMTS